MFSNATSEFFEPILVVQQSRTSDFLVRTSYLSRMSERANRMGK